jgi:hypothetical protein
LRFAAIFLLLEAAKPISGPQLKAIQTFDERQDTQKNGVLAAAEISAAEPILNAPPVTREEGRAALEWAIEHEPARPLADYLPVLLRSPLLTQRP